MLELDATRGLVLVHTAATLVMLGVILIVQVVHYPLFGLVGDATYAAYQQAHMRRITWVVFPAMAAELLTAFALVVWTPPGIPAWLVWTGLALVGVIWASTGLLQVPLHSALVQGFDADVHRRLVLTNWVRTVAWLLRGALVLLMLGWLLSVEGS